ncbi:iron-siderophore ABC transporter periplsamic protein [Staphylococcus gallinarum]|uniref:Iron-siderophore ABC transporter periplsamic protein n=1 Tax=Staphylococcus gallinarum TaxID=1293 RepID=A0A380FN16_STAGA|nr:iron-siderophore ABC transporter periplsamic protein [Staphylococcus gallinarum]
MFFRILNILKMDKVKKINPEDVEAAAKLKPDLIITYKEK